MKKVKLPPCFANLDIVFPMGENGLRKSPQKCLECAYKTICLQSAYEKNDEKAIEAKEELIDRAYDSKLISFLGRWSEKKLLKNQKAN